MKRFTSSFILIFLQVIAAVHSRKFVTRDLSSNELLPRDCGEDHSKRDLDREEVDANEFPWIVILDFTDENGDERTVCNGFLISKRYALTAAQCVVNAKKNSTLSVRFGGNDCGEKGLKKCEHDPISIDVEEQIVHENYNPKSSHPSDDIALLRLSQDATFDGNVKPVCLPSGPSTVEEKFGVVSTWVLLHGKSAPETKLKYKVPIHDHARCLEFYRSYADFNDLQICAGFEDKKDFCQGSGGGPLMTWSEGQEDQRKWKAIGIVSFGPHCLSSIIKPTVYTKVADYVPWILSKMRA